ncbi:signal transduction histidine kinase [Candidatus Scalindua japonica]|uniref:histidine kinase n=2 Tax=Candidatus Scalindua japonica TaxID=1284222 RepID=A0A286TUI3_9BACT|nr:signal transduction histidine kinase [Candidatus Scalindua japonica]
MKKDGTQFYAQLESEIEFDQNGHQCRIIITDITIQKRGEESLRQQFHINKTITDNAASCLFMMDKQGYPTFMNPAAEAVTGYTLDQICAMPLHDSIHHHHPDGRPYPKCNCPIDNAEAEMKGYEDIFIRRDGTFFPVICYIAPLEEKGKDVGCVLEFHDVTEQKKVERELLKHKEQLETLVDERTKALEEKVLKLNKSEKALLYMLEDMKYVSKKLKQRSAELEASNEELNTFSYSVSHDLQAPLRGIDGFSKILITEYADVLDEQGKSHLQRIRKATMKMSHLINDLLSFSRISSYKTRYESLDLSQKVGSIAIELKEASEAGHRVDFIIQEGVVAYGDNKLLNIVLDNLLQNAWKFTAKKPRAKIEFGVTHVNGEEVYFIRDNGVGFDMKYAGKLFGTFQRLHSEKEYMGTGIGLATVRRIINRHGGQVWAEGQEEKGAIFYFKLPGIKKK